LDTGSLEEAHDAAKLLDHNSTKAKGLRHRIREAQALLKAALWRIEANRQGQAFEVLTMLLKECWASPRVYLLRAECALKLDTYPWVRHDTNAVLNFEPANTRALALLADALYRSVGSADMAAMMLKRCLMFNPEDEACKKQYRRVRNIQVVIEAARRERKLQAWNAATLSYLKALRADSEGMSIYSHYVHI